MMAADAVEGADRRRVAVLAADLCGYSRLVAEDENATLACLLADRDLIREIVEARDGRIFNFAGDAVLAEFASAAEGLAAAVGIQERIARRNRSEPEARRMRYRIGITVGDVLDRDGDLFGDAVNVASRLEKLAAPGGICIARAALDGAGATFPHAIQDIGLQRLKNMPLPVHACLVAPEAVGDVASPVRSRRRRPVGVILSGVMLAAGSLAVLSLGGALAWLGRQPTGSFVFPPDEEPARAEATGPGPFRPDAVPFVDDAGRASIAAAVARDPGSAVAISTSGVVGIAPGQGEADKAGRDAVRRCFGDGGLNCRLYAVDGRVVWPDPPPRMPPRPWVDAAVAPTPFDPARIAGLHKFPRLRLSTEYAEARPFKALAVGPRGIWEFTRDKASAEEAERLALESCGQAVGSPCRIVALGDSFVVPLRRP